MKLLFTILPFLFITSVINAQVDTTVFRKNLDKVLEDITSEKESSEFYDLIEYLIDNPININSATEDELLKIPTLDRESAVAIIKQRNSRGGFSSPDAIKNIEGIRNDVVDKIIPFLNFNSKNEVSLFDHFTQNIQSLKYNYRSRMLRDLQQDYAYQKGKYYGSDLKIYNRLILNNKDNIHAAVIIEKDPGEKSLSDFYSFHLLLKDLGLIKNLVFGDFNLEFGQGLALYSRSSISKGTETVDIVPRNGRGIIPYQSTDENMFFRGTAAQMILDNFNIYAFYSNKYLDGSTDQSTGQIKTLITDGLHRDSTEILHKHNINEIFYGAALNYTYENIFEIGMLYTSSHFGNDFYKQTILDPTGKQFNYLSTSYNFRMGKLYLSGETAYNQKVFATINSAQIAVDKNISVVFSYRNYPVDYWNFHANSFGEKDGTQNENGFYTGVHWRTTFGIFDFYYDQFRFPITSDNFMFPSQGNDFLLYYTVKPFRATELRVKYKIKSKDYTGTLTDQLALINGTTENYRVELLYNAARNIELKSRIEIVNVHSTPVQPAEKGFLIYQDVQFSPFAPLNFSSRIIFFKTDSYNSRVYEFESDLTGVMTTPPLYGDGMRLYFLARFTTPLGFALTLKYAETFMPNEKTLGNGDTFINSNVDNRLSFQVDYNF